MGYNSPDLTCKGKHFSDTVSPFRGKVTKKVIIVITIGIITAQR